MSQAFHIPLFLYILVSFLGYGLLAGVLTYRRTIDLGFAAALGMAVFVAIGGILNVFSAIGPVAVDATLALGTLLFLLLLFTRGDAIRKNILSFAREPAFFVSLLVFVFTLIFYAPTYALNPHDDLTQYLTRPSGMLAFGNAAWNPFDSTGADSLGGHFWLLAAVVRYLDLTYAPALDSSLLLFLACMALISTSRALNAGRLTAVAAVSLFIFIYPATVNVSAVYSIALMSCCLALACLEPFADSSGRLGKVSGWSFALMFVPIGFALAALVTLKMTTLPFVVFFTLLLLCVSPMVFKSVRDFSQAGIAVGLVAATAILAWALPFSSLYWQAYEFGTYQGGAANPAGFAEWGIAAFKRNPWFNWFSLETVQYGQIGAVQALCCLLAFLAGSRELWLKRNFGLAALFYSSVLYFIAAPGFSPWGYLRYTAPVMNMVACIAFLAITSPARMENVRPAGYAERLHSYAGGVVAWLVAIVIVVSMSGTFQDRVKWAVAYRTSSGIAPIYVASVQNLLGPQSVNELAAVQAVVPENRTILAAAIPVLAFDFTRNPIFPVFTAGLISSWWPDMGGFDRQAVQKILSAYGIEYLILQISGAWVIAEDTHLIHAGERISVFRKSGRNYWILYYWARYGGLGEILHESDQFVVIRIAPPCSGDVCDKQTSEVAMELGKEIRLSEQKQIPAYFRYGWSTLEPTGVWSREEHAGVRFDLAEKPTRPLRLTATLSAFPGLNRPALPIDVTAFGEKVGRWEAGAQSRDYCVDLPPHLFIGGSIMLNFHFHNPVSPASLGIGSEPRRLGMHLQTFTLENGTCSEPGGTLPGNPG